MKNIWGWNDVSVKEAWDDKFTTKGAFVQGTVGFGGMHGRGAGWLQNWVVSGFHHLDHGAPGSIVYCEGSLKWQCSRHFQWRKGIHLWQLVHLGNIYIARRREGVSRWVAEGCQFGWKSWGRKH
jgi:hypothetical protein